MQKQHVGMGLVLVTLAGLAALACTRAHDTLTPPERLKPRWVKPNIVLVVLDDVGFGQLSAFGGPIPTPNIERIASQGLRFTSFHSACTTSCTPVSTRSFVQTLRDNGYSTLALGRWRGTPAEDVTTRGPYERWPQSLGFEHFYGFFGEGMNQWAPSLWNDRRPVAPADTDYLLDRDLGERAVKYVQDKDESGEPFLLYVAPGAGHAPHHAPQAFLERNRGRFDQGWDVVRSETFARQKQLGIMPEEAALPPRPDVIPAWDSLPADQRRLFARMQEAFAASVEHADAQLGRVLDELEDTGHLDNTIFVVTSDGGASGDGGLVGTANVLRAANGLPERVDLDAIDDLGGPRALSHYPAGWALAGNTPGRSWNGSLHEGGARVPFVIAWPERLTARGELRRPFVEMTDLAPTLLDLARVPAQEGIGGTSFATTLTDAAATPPRASRYLETPGGIAVWAGGWKAIAESATSPWERGARATARWELYHLDVDPNETHDLVAEMPDKLVELRTLLSRERSSDESLDLGTKLLVEQRARPLGARREWQYEGVTRATPEVLAAPVLGHSHSITAHVRVTRDAEPAGVLATCGGRFGGYALYVERGKLTYVHNYVGDARYVITSEERIFPGERELRFVFEKTGERGGRGRLYVDGVLGGEGEIPNTVPIVFSATESCDTGLDTGTAAGDYEVPFHFTGRLHDVTISVE